MPPESYANMRRNWTSQISMARDRLLFFLMAYRPMDAIAFQARTAALLDTMLDALSELRALECEQITDVCFQ